MDSASTAACSRLMKLDHRKTVMALGISGSMAGEADPQLWLHDQAPSRGHHEQRRGDCDPLWQAWAVTKRRPVAWSTRWAFVHAISGPGFYDVDAMADGLGEEFFTQSSLNIKRYPTSVVRNLDIVDCILGLMQDHGVPLRGRRGGGGGPGPGFSGTCSLPGQQDELQAKFSALYNVAAALVDGKVDIETFTPEKVNSPVIQEAMNKVQHQCPAQMAEGPYRGGAPRNDTSEGWAGAEADHREGPKGGHAVESLGL